MDDLKALAEFSARIGSDPEQVQAGGGNTSLKLDGTLWVKASGFWLADATKSDLFVPVDTARVLDAIDGGDEGDVRAATIADKNPAGLRPSIETSLHALLPHRFVVHTHSVRTIAIAIRKDAEARFAERFPGRRLVLAFQPHRYTRTRDCFEDFVKVLGSVDALVLADVYAAGEPPVVAADGRALARALRVAGRIEPVFVEDIDDMPATIGGVVRDGDVVLTMGAGSIGAVPGKLVNEEEA